MKRDILVVMLCLWVLSLSFAALAATSAGGTLSAVAKNSQSPAQTSIHKPAKSVSLESLDRQPLLFIRNDGQLDEKVKYYERGANHATYFTADGIYLSLFRRQIVSGQSGFAGPENKHSIQFDQVMLSFINAAPNPLISATDIQAAKYNYYVGNDPARWRKNISTYKAVKYTEIYKNIDLKVYGNNRQLEYDVIVKPGGDPAAVRFKYEGADSLAINAAGELEIKLAHSTLIQKSPSLYQEISGRRVEVAGRFKLLADNSYTFEIPAYDRKRVLIIDPVIEYTGFLGGDQTDVSNAVAVDDAGNAYYTGMTISTDFNNVSRVITTYHYDVFVVKVSPQGSNLYTSIFGGTADDDSAAVTHEAGFAVAVDNAGNVHVTGATPSDDFPIVGSAFQSVGGGNGSSANTDAFYVALDGSGDIIYSSYLGGRSSWERGNAIAVDNSGDVCIAGGIGPYHYPATLYFPVWGENILQPDYGGDSDPYDSSYPSDAFITKFNFNNLSPANTSLAFSTYFGGSGSEVASGIVVDGTGDIYIAGATLSNDLPGVSTSSIQAARAGGYDAFVTKINSDATAIIYSTYLGGGSPDYGLAIAVDSFGCAYVTGYINRGAGAYSFPLVNPIQNETKGGDDAFVTKINAAGSSIDYSTFLGGADRDRGSSIAVDSHGSAYIAGRTKSTDFPLVNPLAGQDPSNGYYYDAFIARLTPLGGGLLYSTNYGGQLAEGFQRDDYATGIAVDNNGNAYISGATDSACLPVAFGQSSTCDSFGGVTDGLKLRLSDNSTMPQEVISVAPADGAAAAAVDSVISAVFINPLNTSSLAGHFHLYRNGSPVAGTVGSSGDCTATFTPASPLAYETLHTAAITTGVTDTSGTPLLAAYIWEFTTEAAAPDPTPPTILSTVPDTSDENMVENVPVNSVVTVTFSEAMDPSTINSENLRLESFDELTFVETFHSCTLNYNDENYFTATITPDEELPYGTDITLRVSYQVADLAGNLLSGGGYTGAFKTECDPNAPTLISSYPANYPAPDSMGIPVDAELTFTFSADMNPATLSANTVPIYYFTPSETYIDIDGVYTYNAVDKTLTFTPSSPLPFGTGIMALFRETVADAEGRHVCYPIQGPPLYVYFFTEDNDGVTDQEEQGPDGNDIFYDGNGDGNPDWFQANVTSLHSHDGSKYVTLSCPEGQLLENIVAEANPSPSDTPGGVAFPVGFYNFTITGLEAGGATTLTLNLPAGETVNSYWKYGPTPDNPSNHWYNFMYDEVTGTGAVINGNEIVLHFVDGQRGDDILTPDAKIIEPGAPGFTNNIFDFNSDNDVDGDDLAEFAARLQAGNLSADAVESFAAVYGH